MPPLDGRRIALLESRKSAELAVLVRRLGGTPVVAPTVREAPHLEEVARFVDALLTRRQSFVIFQTGAGALHLLSEAERRGQLPDVLAALLETTIVCRGPKPVAAIKRYGLTPTIMSERPHTTREVLEGLADRPLDGVQVLLVHYGERNAALAAALEARGARLQEVFPYEWSLPDDVAPIEDLVRDVIGHRVDAVLFTSQVQCRHLFQVADTLGLAGPLADSLNRDVVVGAIGPVSAEALRQVGVVPDVLPGAANMPSLITAIADYFELTGPADAV